MHCTHPQPTFQWLRTTYWADLKAQDVCVVGKGGGGFSVVFLPAFSEFKNSEDLAAVKQEKILDKQMKVLLVYWHPWMAEMRNINYTTAKNNEGSDTGLPTALNVFPPIFILTRH